MPQVFSLGSLNTAALYVADTYVQIIPPQNLVINGLPTNVLAIAGTATWGPVNSPTIIGAPSDNQRMFGPLQPRKYDLGTAVAVAALQGANNFRCVRVTDGTDTASTGTITATGTAITFTSLYTGSYGNNISVTIAAGSQTNTWKATVSMPGRTAEIFDNISGAANAFWQNLATAINLGQSGFRGPSQIITAVAGSGTGVPVAGTTNLAGGTDGASGVTTSMLTGVDTIPRKGMYAFRGTGASVGMLTDSDDSTQWSTICAFALSEGIYMIGTGPVGDTVANAVSVKSTAGIDCYGFKLMLGDWVYWNDTYNGQIRLISPQAFVAGKLVALSPREVALNKPLAGIVGTQRTNAQIPYSLPELQSLVQAGIDVITNPIPRGSGFGCRTGHNTSSNPMIFTDNYPRLTNFIAYTLATAMGIYDGEVVTPDYLRRVKNTIDSFCSGLAGATPPLISTIDGSVPWLCVCDASNNPQNRAALGLTQADVKVVYGPIAEKILVNLEAGASVTINRVAVGAAGTV